MSLLHFFGFNIAREPGAIVEVDCPRCRTKTRAQIERVVESVSLLHLIPLFKKQTDGLRCLNCGTDLSLMAADAGLAHRNYLKGVKKYEQNVSPALKFAAVVSVFLSLVPTVGVLFSLVTMAVSWRRGGWPKTVATAAVVLSFLVSCVVFPVFVRPSR